MSTMEFNKGKLIPIEMNEEIAKDILAENGMADYSGPDYSAMEALRDEVNDYAEIGDDWYRVEFEFNGTDCYGFQQAKKLDNGEIEFMTYHYNGGGHWTEVVEGSLKKGGELEVFS